MDKPNFDPRSPVGLAEAAYLAAQARLNAIEQEAGQIGRDLRETEAQWSAATYATTTGGDFAALVGRRTLLQRAAAAIKPEIAQAQAALAPAKLTYEQRMRGMLDARDRLTHARRQGNRAAAQAAQRHLDHLTTADVDRQVDDAAEETADNGAAL